MHEVTLCRLTAYVFNALAFLPFDRDDQRCLLFPEANTVSGDYRNLNYFVLFKGNRTLLDVNGVLSGINGKKNAVLNKVLWVSFSLET